jgi:hypothetical protein
MDLLFEMKLKNVFRTLRPHNTLEFKMVKVKNQGRKYLFV